MVSYKNIRIKTRGGGTRVQRVKVLASGKYKFVKNVGRKLTRRSSKKKTTRKRGVRRMARRYRRKRGRGKNTTATLFKLARLGSLVAPGIYHYQQVGGGSKGLQFALTGYGGIGPDLQFNWNVLKESWLPYGVTALVTHGIPKLIGIIRRL